MRIAQVAPLYECVPPKLYGGTERIVSYLTEELVRHGHDVTLFASGDSLTNANLIPISPQALRLDTKCIDQLAHHVRMLEAVVARQNEFDLIHFHIDYIHFPSGPDDGLDHFNDTPRPPGHFRPCPSVSGIQGDAGFVDLACTARTIAVVKLARNGVSRTS